MGLFIKALAGAAVVILIAYLSKSKNYYLVGLVPLFPTFALLGHIVVGVERTTEELKQVVMFGMWATIPYLSYLIAVYFLIQHFRLWVALSLGVVLWSVVSLALVFIWNKSL